jgi:hypothetical protein
MYLSKDATESGAFNDVTSSGALSYLFLKFNKNALIIKIMNSFNN